MAQIELRRDAGRVGPATGPWIRKRQISQIQGLADPRKLVALVDKRKNTIAWGLVSPESAITLRVLSWGEHKPADDWLVQRLERAFAARRAYDFEGQGTTGYREVNSEGDQLPGLVIDRYGAEVVVQITTAPMAAREQQIRDWLQTQQLDKIYVVRPEHAAEQAGLVAHQAAPEPATPDHGEHKLRFMEQGLSFEVPAPPSQKTGAYFDQRCNRIAVAKLALHQGGPLLDLGCHVGGFALHAQKLGVPTLGLDQSKTALAHAAHNASINGMTEARWVCGDMFATLERYPELQETFGTIVLDPPKMVVRKAESERALGALAKLVGQAGKRLQAGGHLVVCSCSYHLGRDQLDKIMAKATGVWTRVQTLGAGPDHPVAPGHREGEYLRVNIYQLRA